MALDSPLLETTVAGASDIIINFAGEDVTLMETVEAVDCLTEVAGADANIIYGTSIGDELGEGEISITIIATGLDEPKSGRKKSMLDEYVNATYSAQAAAKAAAVTPPTPTATVSTPQSAAQQQTATIPPQPVLKPTEQQTFVTPEPEKSSGGIKIPDFLLSRK
jgi:cell division protein FtsZ